MTWQPRTGGPYQRTSNMVRALGRDVLGERSQSSRASSGSNWVGLSETVIYLPTVSDQETLDAAAAAVLAGIAATRSKDTSSINMNQLMETIVLEVIDENEAGLLNPEDQITITSATLGCSGLYRTKRIERDLTDPNYAKIDMTTRHLEYWELDENMRRTVRNLNTLV